MGKCRCILENCVSNTQFSYKLGETYSFNQVDDFWGSYFYVFIDLIDLSKSGFSLEDFLKYFEIIH